MNKAQRFLFDEETKNSLVNQNLERQNIRQRKNKVIQNNFSKLSVHSPSSIARQTKIPPYGNPTPRLNRSTEPQTLPLAPKQTPTLHLNHRNIHNLHTQRPSATCKQTAKDARGRCNRALIFVNLTTKNSANSWEG